MEVCQVLRAALVWDVHAAVRKRLLNERKKTSLSLRRVTILPHQIRLIQCRFILRYCTNMILLFLHLPCSWCFVAASRFTPRSLVEKTALWLRRHCEDWVKLWSEGILTDRCTQRYSKIYYSFKYLGTRLMHLRFQGWFNDTILRSFDCTHAGARQKKHLEVSPAPTILRPRLSLTQWILWHWLEFTPLSLWVLFDC